MNNKVIIILGPTAIGKTNLATKLAFKCNGEIISADSRQVYRGMDIGTGKDLDEYNGIPYHLIDILDPSENYSVSELIDNCLSKTENTIPNSHPAGMRIIPPQPGIARLGVGVGDW